MLILYYTILCIILYYIYVPVKRGRQLEAMIPIQQDVEM
jgi:hypothetical protein